NTRAKGPVPFFGQRVITARGGPTGPEASARPGFNLTTVAVAAYGKMTPETFAVWARISMANASYRGVVRQGTVQLLEKALLAEGTEVLVTPLSNRQGTPAAVLAALAAAPAVPVAWVDELEQLISEGQRPPTRDDPFAKAPGEPVESVVR